MDSISREINNPAWWFTAIFAAIFVNLLAAFLKNPLDKWLSKTGSWWQSRSQASKDKRKKEIAELAADDIAIQLTLLHSQNAYRKGVEGMFLCILLFLAFLAFRFIVIPTDKAHLLRPTSLSLLIATVITLFLSFVLFQIAGSWNRRAVEALEVKAEKQNPY